MKKTISCLLAILMLAALVGCGAKEKIAEKAAEEFIEGIGGGNVDIDGDNLTIEGEDGENFAAGDNLSWPGDKMGDLPEPKASVSAVLNDDATQQCTVAYQGMEKDDAEAYVEKLKKLGYTGGMDLSDADMIMTSGYNSAGDKVDFIYNTTAKEGTISYARQAQQTQSDQTPGSQETDADMTDAAPWPSDILPGIPEMQGKIMDIVKGEGSVFVDLQYVEKADFQAFMQELQDAGYTSDLDITEGLTDIDFRAYNEAGDWVNAVFSDGAASFTFEKGASE